MPSWHMHANEDCGCSAVPGTYPKAHWAGRNGMWCIPDVIGDITLLTLLLLTKQSKQQKQKIIFPLFTHSRDDSLRARSRITHFRRFFFQRTSERITVRKKESWWRMRQMTQNKVTLSPLPLWQRPTNAEKIQNYMAFFQSFHYIHTFWCNTALTNMILSEMADKIPPKLMTNALLRATVLHRSQGLHLTLYILWLESQTTWWQQKRFFQQIWKTYPDFNKPYVDKSKAKKSQQGRNPKKGLMSKEIWINK